jgi:glutamate-1-semialdehyde 2,1-aminomutase
MGVSGDSRHSEPYPLMFERARGKWLTDVDGTTYLDYHGGFGTAILGYAHPEVDEAVVRATHEVGAFVGVPHPYEGELAERLCSLIPFAERIAFCGGGGSDAIYHGIRVARAATGRTRLVKLEGGYHGWHADVGVSTRPPVDATAGAGRAEGVANSTGSLPAVSHEVSVVEANDAAGLEEVLAAEGDSIACVIIEPLLYSAGCIPIDHDYLRLARRLCTKYGVVLFFDEIMSGVRGGLGGAGWTAGVAPDLAAFGKAVANGYMLSFLAGSAALMTTLAPEGRVFYSGTFNAHPLSVAAVEATLNVVERERVPQQLVLLGDLLASRVNACIDELGLPAVCQAAGGVWTLYLGTRSVRNYREFAYSVNALGRGADEELRLFLLARGIYLHKRFIHRGFISATHTEADVLRTGDVICEFLRELAASLWDVGREKEGSAHAEHSA